MRIAPSVVAQDGILTCVFFSLSGNEIKFDDDKTSLAEVKLDQTIEGVKAYNLALVSTHITRMHNPVGTMSDR